MTVNQLHKFLGALICKGHGRKLVCVDKSKISHPLESDGVCIIPINAAELCCHEMVDEDGGMKVLANGRTATRTAVVLTAQ